MYCLVYVRACLPVPVIFRSLSPDAFTDVQVDTINNLDKENTDYSVTFT